MRRTKNQYMKTAKITFEEVMFLVEIIEITNNLGDILKPLIIGLIASLLPPDNIIKTLLQSKSGSTYYNQKLVANSLSKIDICINGCLPFVGENADLEHCTVCNTLREIDNPLNKEIYYFQIKERLMAIIKSDLSRLLHYSEYRYKENFHYVEEINNGKNWKIFSREMDSSKNEKLLALQWCWYGADAL